MATEMTFIVDYRCARCDAALEARSGQAYGWLRCPRCGRATLPPEHMKTPRRRDRTPLGPDVLVIGPEPSRTSSPARSSYPSGSFRRVAGASAMFLSLLIALLSLLEHDQIGSSVFAIIALVCLAVSVYPARARMA